MYKGYTFNPITKKHWYCSRRSRNKCQARVHIDDTETVLTFSNDEHNHSKPMYHITSDGYYFKIK